MANKITSIFDLIEDPNRVVINTPEHLVEKGVPAQGWVEVIDAQDSLEFTAVQLDYFSRADAEGNVRLTSKKDYLELNARLAAAIIIGWDESYFGPFSKDKVLKILTTPRFFYVIEAITAYTESRQDFFKNA